MDALVIDYKRGREISVEDMDRILDIVNYWNDKNIIHHKVINTHIQYNTLKSLNDYGEDAVKEVIDHYATMFHDDEYMFCDYKWPLYAVMNTRAFLDFLEDGKKWANYCYFKERQAGKQAKQIIRTPLADDVNIKYNACIEEMKAMPYPDYLFTDHWQHFKAQALINARSTCQLCGANDKQLDVHHKSYDNRGRETFLDVIVLCHDCHAKFHDK